MTEQPLYPSPYPLPQGERENKSMFSTEQDRIRFFDGIGSGRQAGGRVRIARVVVPGYPHHVTRCGVRRRLWITFWRRFWGVFLGDFLEATGPGASVRGDFSADGVPLVRWASADFDFFRGFFAFLGRFLPVFGPYFALFPSMPCAYLYVNNYFSASLACRLLQGGIGERGKATRNAKLGTRNKQRKATRRRPRCAGPAGQRPETK